MKLNDHSYVHIRIKKLCQMMAYMTNMELATDLSQEFEQIEFVSRWSYIIIDYKTNTCLVMSHKLTKKEQDIAEDIMIHANWLETGKRYINSIRL